LAGTQQYSITCFVDDESENHGKLVNEVPVFGLEQAWQRFPGALIVGGVGHPRTRERLMQRAKRVGFEFETIVHPRVERSRWIEYGSGVMICAGCVLSTDIVLGAHVQINRCCIIGHDVVMAEYATLAPGVNVSGTVQIGRRAYIGAGAVIKNGTPGAPISIGDDAIVGAGACVTRSVPAGTTVIGVPARPMQK
jgi:sugar O-acyltransferase (sialic acid O-acetyltransferase NeuD family)